MPDEDGRDRCQGMLQTGIHRIRGTMHWGIPDGTPTQQHKGIIAKLRKCAKEQPRKAGG